MSYYKQYKSPLGYQMYPNGIDSYGVNHQGFSTKDELLYHSALQQKESDLMKQYNNQGITENYPQ